MLRTTAVVDVVSSLEEAIYGDWRVGGCTEEEVMEKRGRSAAAWERETEALPARQGADSAKRNKPVKIKHHIKSSNSTP